MPKYIYNPETMLYEEHVEPKGRRTFRMVLMVLFVLGIVCLYVWIYVSVLGLDAPKTAILKKRHAIWESEMVILDRQLDLYEQTLSAIEDRDDNVYRSIYGLPVLSEEEKTPASDGFVNHDYLVSNNAASDLRLAVVRMDDLSKRNCVRSEALDDVSVLALEAGDMISCVPSVPPLLPKPGTFRLSSSFGGRRDPVYGGYEYHTGQDFATSRGNPVYATGDGTVVKTETNYRGYGNEIVIDHGYGYQTRYAHLSTIEVREGMKVSRGERIGTVGNTGKSTGPHLHYEVEYRGKKVNPMRYMDINMPYYEYEAMITKRSDESERGKKSTTTELLRRRRHSDER